jgi:hypothetical protein
MLDPPDPKAGREIDDLHARRGMLRHTHLVDAVNLRSPELFGGLRAVPRQGYWNRAVSADRFSSSRTLVTGSYTNASRSERNP